MFKKNLALWNDLVIKILIAVYIFASQISEAAIALKPNACYLRDVS